MRWLLIDRLEQCEAGKRAVGVKAFSRSESFFMDHYPGKEMVPGVLEIEMIAQTATACLRLMRPRTFFVLSKIQSARFIKPICPGDQCRITVQILKMLPHHLLAAGYIEVDGQRVGEAEFVGNVVPLEASDTKDLVIEDWIRRQGGSCEQDALETSSAAIA